MNRTTDNIRAYGAAKKTAEKIFRAKKRYHLSQCRLPIEEKVRKVIELQKMVFEIKKGSSYLKNKVIWKI